MGKKHTEGKYNKKVILVSLVLNMRSERGSFVISSELDQERGRFRHFYRMTWRSVKLLADLAVQKPYEISLVSLKVCPEGGGRCASGIFHWRRRGQPEAIHIHFVSDFYKLCCIKIRSLSITVT
jgi:hypothetical protein